MEYKVNTSHLIIFSPVHHQYSHLPTLSAYTDDPHNADQLLFFLILNFVRVISATVREWMVN